MPASAPKRVLIFSLQYHPFIGGAEVALQEITDRMSPDEFEFHLVTPWYDSALPREEVVGNVHVHRIGLRTPHPSMADLKKMPLNLNKKLFQVLATFEAERLHRMYHFDLVWAMMAHSTAIPAGIFKKRHKDVPYLLTLQEGDPPEYIERLMRPVMPFFKQGFREADALQAISTFLATWGVRMGFSGTPDVIPNAVDTKRFSVQHEAHEGIRLVTTSRLVHKNAVDDVIRALSHLPQHIRLTIAGTGPDETLLRNLVSECRLGARVEFLGNVSQSELPTLLAACDIFIRPSRSEGMGISFLEAMAAGLPVIATQEGGLADFIYDAQRNPDKETTGWAVDKDSPEQIADTVERILTHPDETQKVTKTAKNLVLEKYDWDMIGARMKTLFESLWKTT